MMSGFRRSMSYSVTPTHEKMIAEAYLCALLQDIQQFCVVNITTNTVDYRKAEFPLGQIFTKTTEN